LNYQNYRTAQSLHPDAAMRTFDGSDDPPAQVVMTAMRGTYPPTEGRPIHLVVDPMSTREKDDYRVLTILMRDNQSLYTLLAYHI
jgi:hypothetical protein